MSSSHDRLNTLFNSLVETSNNARLFFSRGSRQESLLALHDVRYFEHQISLLLQSPPTDHGSNSPIAQRPGLSQADYSWPTDDLGRRTSPTSVDSTTLAGKSTFTYSPPPSAHRSGVAHYNGQQLQQRSSSSSAHAGSGPGGLGAAATAGSAYANHDSNLYHAQAQGQQPQQQLPSSHLISPRQEHPSALHDSQQQGMAPGSAGSRSGPAAHPVAGGLLPSHSINSPSASYYTPPLSSNPSLSGGQSMALDINNKGPQAERQQEMYYPGSTATQYTPYSPPRHNADPYGRAPSPSSITSSHHAQVPPPLVPRASYPAQFSPTHSMHHPVTTQGYGSAAPAHNHSVWTGDHPRDHVAEMESHPHPVTAAVHRQRPHSPSHPLTVHIPPHHGHPLYSSSHQHPHPPSSHHQQGGYGGPPPPSSHERSRSPLSPQQSASSDRYQAADAHYQAWATRSTTSLAASSSTNSATHMASHQSKISALLNNDDEDHVADDYPHGSPPMKRVAMENSSDREMTRSASNSPIVRHSADPKRAYGGITDNRTTNNVQALRGNGVGGIPSTSSGGGGGGVGSRTQFHAPLEPEVVQKLDELFFKFLQRICSDLDARDSKGDYIHQPLMAKKMQRLEASADFRPFKFRIQAFTNAFHESLIQHGLTEDILPLRKVKVYLWKHRYISRFNEDGKKQKSKGNHVWNIEARRIAPPQSASGSSSAPPQQPSTLALASATANIRIKGDIDGGVPTTGSITTSTGGTVSLTRPPSPPIQWEFREYTSRIAGQLIKFARVGVRYTYAPRIWDAQMSCPEATYSSPSLPPWLKWHNKELVGVPRPEDKSCTITVQAVYDREGTKCELEMSFFLTILDQNQEEQGGGEEGGSEKDDEETEQLKRFASGGRGRPALLPKPVSATTTTGARQPPLSQQQQHPHQPQHDSGGEEPYQNNDMEVDSTREHQQKRHLRSTRHRSSSHPQRRLRHEENGADEDDEEDEEVEGGDYIEEDENEHDDDDDEEDAMQVEYDDRSDGGGEDDEDEDEVLNGPDSEGVMDDEDEEMADGNELSSTAMSSTTVTTRRQHRDHHHSPTSSTHRRRSSAGGASSSSSSGRRPSSRGRRSSVSGGRGSTGGAAAGKLSRANSGRPASKATTAKETKRPRQ